jgi:hypothetical protein
MSVVEMLQSIGFELNKGLSTDTHFHMSMKNPKLEGTIDAEGGTDYFEIYYGNDSYTDDFDENSIEKIKEKIKEWENDPFSAW